MKTVILYILIFVGFTFSLQACDSNDNSLEKEKPSIPDPNPAPKPSNERSLILYFSRSGNTSAVANEIGQQTNGTIIEIIPTTAYPSDYNATLSRSQTEIKAIDKDDIYPSLNTEIESFDNYDVIFICTPLWYSRMSTPVQSFLKKHSQKLAGKQLVLAVTSSSSGISSVISDAQRLTPNSTIIGDPLWVKSSQVENIKSIVSNWLKNFDLNFNQSNDGQFDLSKGQNGEAPTIKLNSGYDMPIVGLGTYSLNGDVSVNSIVSAIKRGYRKFDSAYLYNNEESVGEGIRQSGIPREEIFVATKLAPSQFSDAENAIDLALKKLNLEYIDLMLLHHPGSNDVAAYKAMEKAVAAGKIRSIGLSNYYIKEMSAFLPQVSIKPALVQNEIHPYYQDTEVIEYMHNQGIVVEAWYPLGGRGHTATMFKDPTIASIAQNHGKTSAQIILRWDLQRGVVVIPGSSNSDHQKENISIFDFELTNEEMSKINTLNRDEKHDWY